VFPRSKRVAVSLVLSVLILAALSALSPIAVADLGRSSSSPQVEARVKPLIEVDGKSFRDLNNNGVVDPYEDWRLPVEERVEDLLSRMTIEEKAGQMIHSNLFLDRDGSLPPFFEDWLQDNSLGFLYTGGTCAFSSPKAAANITNQLQEWAESSRLGIPIVISMDSTTGLSYIRGATVFPAELGLAASRNVELVRELSEIEREESLAVGIRMTLSPDADVATEPRWGRVQETFGENADLVAEMIRARVEALQAGSELNENSLLVSVKHFPGTGPEENGKDANPIISTEDSIGYHLRPFKAAIEAGAGSIMPYGYSTVPYLGGDAITLPAHESEVVMSLLRETLGYTGLIQTDWGMNFARSARNGADVLGGAGVRNTSKVVSELPEEQLDDSVRRILTAKFKLGIFEDPYVDPDRAEEVVGCAEHQALSLEAARQSMILFKNDGILPFSKNERILVAGDRADDVDSLSGGWKSPQPGVSMLQAIKATVGEDRILYEASDPDKAEALAENADVAVVVVGEPPNTHDPVWGPSHLYLSDLQSNMLRAIHETGTPIVVVVIMSRPYVMTWCAQNADAILATSRPGPQGGQAVAEALFGDYNPSGKLPIQIPRSMGQVTAQREDLPYDLGATESEQEQIVSAIKDGRPVPTDLGNPLFPYGYGMSYGKTPKFEYENLQVPKTVVKTQEPFEVSVAVRNAGDDGYVLVKAYSNGEVIGSEFLALKAGGSTRISITCMLAEAGGYEVSVANLPAMMVTAEPAPA